MNTNTPPLTYITNTFTIEFWADPEQSFTLPAQDPGGLYNFGQSFAIFPDWGGTGGAAGVGVCVGTNGISVMEHAYNYLPSLLTYTNALTGWVHVAVVYTNETPVLYVNGTYVKTGITSSRSYVYPSKNFGGSYDTSAGPFDMESYGPYKGLLDEISIYNRALGAGEIQAIYAAGGAGKCYAGVPPAITTQPASEAVSVNGATFFSVVASGSPQLSFQWTFDGTGIAGATNSSLLLTNVQPANAGTYQVTVANAYGSVTSSNATLTVQVHPPVINVQPASISVNVGSNANFSVAASGSAPLSYQWSFDGEPVVGATNAIFTLADAQPGEEGNYFVTVSNIFGAVASSNAVLTVLTYPPAILAQPVSETASENGTTAFSVTASGSPLLTYQWSFDGAAIAGATNSELLLGDLQTNNAGIYAVTVGNPYGSVLSSNAILTVVQAPPCDPPPAGIVNWWPGNGSAADVLGGSLGTLYPGTTYTNGEVGQAFSFNGSTGCVMNTNTPPLTNILNTFTIEFWANPQKSFNIPAQATNGYPGIYGQSYAVFPDWGGNSSGAGVGVCVGINGIAVMEHAPSYLPSLLSYQTSISGWVHVAVVYNNKQPSLYLNGVYVKTGYTSTRSYVYPSKNFGNSYSTASGASVWNYGPYAGLLDEISIYDTALSASQIQAIYNAGSGGKCTPSLVPVITGEPGNKTVAAGQAAVFNLSASGLPVLSYQWSFDGTNIAGATNALLTISDVQAANAGAYQAIVVNAYGAATSSVANLTVVLPPSITEQPVSQTIVSYDSVSFTVVAGGTGPFTYQWQKNGINLTDGANVSGSQSASLTLGSVSLSDAGNYEVLVSNGYASTNSAVAVLTIPQSVVSLGSTNAMSGTIVTVPVIMNALGVEDLFSTSVGYDPNKLVLLSVTLGSADSDAYLDEVDSQTNNGNVGFAVYFSGTLSAGVQQVAQLIFATLPVTNTATVALTLGDIPIARQLVDQNANSLPMATENATVILTPAEYEADVYPRSNGDHMVNLQDWLEEGRFVAGLDIPTNSDEMLRADCSPRNAPDGVLTVADWVQAGRYALGLDPLTEVPSSPPVGDVIHGKGLTQPIIREGKFPEPVNPQPMGGSASIRVLQVGTVSAARGQNVSVPVQLVSLTNENAAGMTISYNPGLLKLAGVTAGSALAGGRINFNTNSVNGKVGLVVALPPGQSFAPGTNQLALLQFVVGTNAANNVPLALNGSLVVLQVVDKTAEILTASYASGAIVTPAPPSVQIVKQGGSLQMSWPAGLGAFQVLSASNIMGPWKTVSVVLSTNGANTTVSVPATNQQQYYKLLGQ